ncbi:hypothetical protein BH09PLA1_BH09PLA1_21710 [soil metagenome]
MGVDLHNVTGGHFGCSGSRWKIYRSVAEQLGWEPRGPRYDDSERLRYSDVDAMALGEALDRAIRSELLPDVLLRAWGGTGDDDAWELQLELDLKSLPQLREFCRGGEFRES